jgi:hypothetical protein
VGVVCGVRCQMGQDGNKSKEPHSQAPVHSLACCLLLLVLGGRHTGTRCSSPDTPPEPRTSQLPVCIARCARAPHILPHTPHPHLAPPSTELRAPPLPLLRSAFCVKRTRPRRKKQAKGRPDSRSKSKSRRQAKQNGGKKQFIARFASFPMALASNG